MIDISDGLSTELGHICEESRVGAEVESQAIPVAAIGTAVREVDRRFALHGGEDYELLFTAPGGKQCRPDCGSRRQADRARDSRTGSLSEGRWCETGVAAARMGTFSEGRLKISDYGSGMTQTGSSVGAQSATDNLKSSIFHPGSPLLPLLSSVEQD